MADEPNDMIPIDPEKKISAMLESHLLPLMHEKDIKNFREQLPADFVEDASEGLDLLQNKGQMESDLKHLNRQMHHQLNAKKTRKRSKAITGFSWAYWAIIITFLLAIVGFIVIRMLLHH